jgi:hypothetical protein
MSATTLDPYQKKTWNDYAVSFQHEAYLYVRHPAHLTQNSYNKICEMRSFILFTNAWKKVVPIPSNVPSFITKFICFKGWMATRKDLAQTKLYTKLANDLSSYHRSLQNASCNPVASVSKIIQKMTTKIMALDQKRNRVMCAIFLSHLALGASILAMAISRFVSDRGASANHRITAANYAFALSLFIDGISMFSKYNHYKNLKAEYQEIGRLAYTINQYLFFYDDNMKALENPSLKWKKTEGIPYYDNLKPRMIKELKPIETNGRSIHYTKPPK